MTQRVPLACGNVMNYERILVGNHEGIVNITINSPEHPNAIDLNVRKELKDAFSALN